MPCNLLKISRADSFVMRRSPVRVREVAQERKYRVTYCKSVNYRNMVCTFIVYTISDNKNKNTHFIPIFALF